jgi:hypothetical protein
MFLKKIVFLTLLFSLVRPECLFAAEETKLIVAGKAYVDSAISTKVSKDDLAPVALTGSYNDLIDKPVNNTAALYEVKSNKITGAQTNDFFEINMDGWVFRATKQANVNYWALRIINQTGASANITTKGQHMYIAAVAFSGSGAPVTLADGAERNPDNEAGDIGYGGGDVFSVIMTDFTNMHMYRGLLSVNTTNAIMSVEKLN